MADTPPPLPNDPVFADRPTATEETGSEDAIAATLHDMGSDPRIIALEEQVIRLQADFENYRRRTRAELAGASEQAAERALVDLLPVLDNLQLAVAQATADNPLLGGLSMVIEQFHALLAAHGIQPITAAGELFDPVWHEAVGTQPSEAQAGTILHVAQAGYRRGEAVLRPARVIVAGVE